MSLADDIASDAAAVDAAPKRSLAAQMEIDAADPVIAKGPDTTMTERLLAGIGHGMIAATQNAKQGFDKVANKLDSSLRDTPVGQAINWVGNRLGMPTADQALSGTNEAIADRHEVAAPLMRSRAGRLGDLVGNVAAAAPTVLIPGANTYAGAALIGGGTGLVTTEGGLEDRLKGAGWGAVGGAAGKGLGDLLKVGVGKLLAAREANLASTAAQNAPRDAAVDLARQYGYKLPPQDVNPGALNAALEGMSGKIKTSQAASQFNQDVTNRAVKSALGLAEDAPLTTEALQGLRQRAGQAYEAIRGTGTVTPGKAYFDALDKITAQANGQAKSFPGLKNDAITEAIQTLKQSTFEAGDAIDATRFLRDAADKAYAGRDKAVGAAYKQAAAVLEDALETHLQGLGNPEALGAFKAARQAIAKTYTVEKALNPATGNVDAGKLAAQLARGKPLSAELKDVATVAAAFPKATQALKQNYNPVSPLDYAFGLLGAMHNPYEAALVFGRPAVRSAILSEPVQTLNAKAAANYSGGALSKVVYPSLASRPLRDLLKVGGAVGAVKSAQE